jgi:ABC-2 type transport system permease protein
LVLRAIAPTMHFQTLNTGLVNTSDLLYFVLFISLFLVLAIRRLENER